MTHWEKIAEAMAVDWSEEAEALQAKVDALTEEVGDLREALRAAQQEVRDLRHEIDRTYWGPGWD